MKKRNVVTLFIGIIMFMFGLHNIDNSINLLLLVKNTGIPFVDRTFLGFHFDAISLYGSGVILALLGFLTSCFSCLEIRENLISPLEVTKRKRKADEIDNFFGST